MKPTSIFALASLILDVRASVSQNATSPCAVVSSSASSAIAAAYATSTVDAQLAYDCLNSVALNASAATDLVESILPFVEWQTDTSYLKNPPSSYLMPAFDVWGSLDTILTNIKTGVYENEYNFQADLFRTFNLAHDGHFRFVPDLLSEALAFRRSVSLVSISTDGVEVPKVYVQSDIVTLNALNSSIGTSSTSAVTQINGQNVYDFLNAWAQLGFLQDPDALYNSVFYEMAYDAQSLDDRWTGYFAGSGRFGNIYPGVNTTIEFENGTISTYPNYAEVIGNFTGVVDGNSFYQTFCTGPHVVPIPDNVTIPIPTPPSLPPTGNPPAYGYPTPIIITSDQQASGYFLDGSAYEDVAVLSMLSFEPYYPIEFQSAVQTFFAEAAAAGKTKLVIDLSGNGGGVILLGYDVFRQLFPEVVQDGYTQFRENEAFNILSEQTSSLSKNFSIDTADDEQVFLYESVPNYQFSLNLTDENFLDYNDMFIPHPRNGDNFTNYLRWNLTDPLTTTNSSWGIGMTITGYGDRQNFSQPFAAEDIIMLYDGACASTCTLFSEFMRTQAGVKSIMMGGRPSTSTIQAIGGVKGANNYPFGYIQELARAVLSNASPEQSANWTALTALTELAQNRSTDNSINVRDNILPDNLGDGLPAQYVYEAADCRLFYTAEMITDVTSIWKSAADAAWNGSKCVAGSLPQVYQTTAERKRRSEEQKVRSRHLKHMSVGKRRARVMSSEKLRPIHGRKVPL